MNIRDYLNGYDGKQPVYYGTRAEFTPDVQADIINRHFGVAPERNIEPQRQAPVVNDNTVSITPDELERLRNYEKIATDPRVKEVFYPKPAPTYDQNPTPAPQQTIEPSNTNSNDDWLKDLLGNSSQPEPAGQPTPQPQNEIVRDPQQDLAINYQKFVVDTAFKHGLDKDDFNSFLYSLDEDALVQIYKSTKVQRPVQQQVQPQAPKDITDVPKEENVTVYQGIGNLLNKRNTIFS